LLAIRAGQTRLAEHLQTLDGLLGESGIPARFSRIATAYRPAAATVREAMAAAEAAFLRFDWGGVGAATEQMAEGARQLETTADALDRIAGATPAARSSVPSRYSHPGPISIHRFLVRRLGTVRNRLGRNSLTGR
ncbi:MAG: hypothetical protein H0V24_13350, partial [Chloroflexia bacterium]|nr:hypothetical protein [Chloroflexia bacterium]